MYRKEVGLQSIYSFHRTWKNSCMFCLYIRSHHQGGCRIYIQDPTSSL